MTNEEKRKKHAEYQRKRYQSMTPDQKKEFLEKRKPIMKKYRENHKESINNHIKEYYQEHKDKKREINKRYRDNHKDKVITIKSLKEEKQNLIKYIEDKINMNNIYLKEETDDENIEYLLIRNDVYKDLLERIKNNNYESSFKRGI